MCATRSRASPCAWRPIWQTLTGGADNNECAPSLPPRPHTLPKRPRRYEQVGDRVEPAVRRHAGERRTMESPRCPPRRAKSRDQARLEIRAVSRPTGACIPFHSRRGHASKVKGLAACCARWGRAGRFLLGEPRLLRPPTHHSGLLSALTFFFSPSCSRSFRLVPPPPFGTTVVQRLTIACW